MTTTGLRDWIKGTKTRAHRPQQQIIPVTFAMLSSTASRKLHHLHGCIQAMVVLVCVTMLLALASHLLPEDCMPVHQRGFGLAKCENKRLFHMT